jgi:hypothetical protein
MLWQTRLTDQPCTKINPAGFLVVFQAARYHYMEGEQCLLKVLLSLRILDHLSYPFHGSLSNPASLFFPKLERFIFKF